MKNEHKKDILKLMLENNGNLGISGLTFNNQIEKYSLLSGVTLIMLATPALYFESLRTVGGIMYLTAAALFLIYTLSSLLDGLHYALNSTENHLKELSKKIEGENRLISILATDYHNQLESTLQRLQFEKNRLTKRIGFLIGALDNLGAIPAVLALYATYVKTQNESILTIIPYPVLSFVVGVYAGCILLKHITNRIEHMCFILESAKKLSENKPSIDRASFVKRNFPKLSKNN